VLHTASPWSATGEHGATVFLQVIAQSLQNQSTCATRGPGNLCGGLHLPLWLQPEGHVHFHVGMVGGLFEEALYFPAAGIRQQHHGSPVHLTEVPDARHHTGPLKVFGEGSNDCPSP
jgi:hypothetical protein